VETSTSTAMPTGDAQPAAISIRTFPSSDAEFAMAAAEEVVNMLPTLTSSAVTDVIAHVSRRLAMRYPGVQLRRQNPLASLYPVLVLYAFRDGGLSHCAAQADD
jgi:hypothetical protein